MVSGGSVRQLLWRVITNKGSTQKENGIIKRDEEKYLKLKSKRGEHSPGAQKKGKRTPMRIGNMTRRGEGLRWGDY